MTTQNRGIHYAVVAYVLWGLFPVYWKALQTVSAREILCHRMVWSLMVIVIMLRYKSHWKWLQNAITNPVTLITFLGTACILALNWLTYIWAINSGYIVETSLGYFINPLVNVLLGVIFLRERPRSWQWMAIMVAASGVLYLTVGYGVFPWIALTLASTFGTYGLLRKTASLNALEGLSMEIGILFLPALAYLLYLEHVGIASFGHTQILANILLPFAGVVTALPLLLFASAARRITLTTLGLLQYIAPTLQFLLGVFVYGEIVTKSRMAGFVAIWIALFIYSIEGIIQGKRRKGLLGN
jgi:chloramphenicol-sensitive protein RarD